YYYGSPQTLIEHYTGGCATPSPTASSTSTPTPTTTLTPTPSNTPDPCLDYRVTPVASTTIVPGVVDIGNHCDDCGTTQALPFAYTLYNQSFNSVNVSSNGNLQFVSNDPSPNNICLPAAALNFAIAAYWDDLRTDDYGGDCPGCGVFISTS